MADVDPSDFTVAELRDELESVDDADALRALLDAEREGKDRKTAKEAIERRLDDVGAAGDEAAGGEESAAEETADETVAVEDDGEEAAAEAVAEEEEAAEDEEAVEEEAAEEEAAEEEAVEEEEVAEEEEAAEEVEEAAEEEAAEEEAVEQEEDDELSRPTADKRHVRALEDGVYRDTWVYCETQQGELLDVSKEMLGKARELMDQYAEDYGDEERVVAVLVGDDVADLAEQTVELGADVAIYHEDDRLSRFLHEPYTEIMADMARSDAYDWKDYDKPRYVLFPATNNGRDLSAQVQAELDSGLASDCSGLYIENNLISNPVKTGEPGEKVEFERVLHMKRPDFSGFEYSTILCLDNPDREFHPQGCSVIPGSFDVPEPDPSREGDLVEHDLELDDDWFRVAVEEHDQLDSGVDLAGHEVVVALGRGIGADPTRGIELGLDLVDAFDDAALGISRGIVTSSYQFDGHVEQYTREERQIGETGQVVEPEIYVAAGISGAIQHKVGMDESDTIIAINTDPEADIRDFSDYFVEGDLFEVLPRLTEAVETGELDVQALADGGKR